MLFNKQKSRGVIPNHKTATFRFFRLFIMVFFCVFFFAFLFCWALTPNEFLPHGCFALATTAENGWKGGRLLEHTHLGQKGEFGTNSVTNFCCMGSNLSWHKAFSFLCVVRGRCCAALYNITDAACRFCPEGPRLQRTSDSKSCIWSKGFTIFII